MNIKIKLSGQNIIAEIEGEECIFPSIEHLRGWLFENHKHDIIKDQWFELECAITSNNRYKKNKLPETNDHDNC